MEYCEGFFIWFLNIFRGGFIPSYKVIGKEERTFSWEADIELVYINDDGYKFLS